MMKVFCHSFFRLPRVASVTLTCLLVLTTTAETVQAASVFSVTRDGRQMYLGGTFHLLRQSDFPLPAAFFLAYSRADLIALETDISALETPAMQQQLQTLLLQPAGQRLQDQLSAQTWQSLQVLLAEKNLSEQSLQPLSATGAMLNLTLMDLRERGFNQEGVDAVFEAMARQDDKRLAYLESPATQLRLLGSFGDEDPNALMQYMLDEIARGEEVIAALHDAWLQGDLQALEEAGITPMRRDYPSLYTVLLSERNRDWMPRIEALMRDAVTPYVLVGALHLAGEDGLVNLLRLRGYEVLPVVLP